MAFDLAGHKLLIFIVAYNAEKTIASVLQRIPAELRSPGVEVLVIDDFSQDATFREGLAQERTSGDLTIRMLRTAVNQGYGGNQKLGYRYAIDHGFDFVALVHGDGQYAPEKLTDLIEPLIKGEADVVFGSRMLHKRDALRGGMPLYKWAGNQVLTWFQNATLGTSLSEFHTGYRLYSTAALSQIPFERNSNDFHFDTEIIVQLTMKEQRIRELPIPTFYGDEICHVNGLKYAWDVARTMIRSQLHARNLFYDRKFDVGAVEQTYDLKHDFDSSHTRAIAAVQPGSRVLDIGCGRGYVAEQLAEKASFVTGIDQYVPESSSAGNLEFQEADLNAEALPVDASDFDQICMLDVIEHLADPETFMETLRHSTAARRPEIILTTANIGFIVSRLMLLSGQFNYGRKGILDRTHTRLFTFRSLRELLLQTGYEIVSEEGIPAPYPKVLGSGRISRLLLGLNQALIRLNRGLFSYQIMIRAKAQPTLEHLLNETYDTSTALKRAIAEGEALLQDEQRTQQIAAH